MVDSQGNAIDVPGKLRWVTTSIARFDPDIDWPTDLEFTVKVNDLTSFDGSKLTEVKSQKYTTQSVSWHLVGVTSASADTLTDGLWDGLRGHWQATKNSKSISSGDREVPDDGVVTVSFSNSPIDIEMVKKVVQLKEVGGSANIDIASSIQECKYRKACFSFSPKALKPNTPYELSLPVGSRYHPLSGPTRRALSVPLYGLFPFELPFVHTPTRASSRLWQLYLRHGLKEGQQCDSSSCPALSTHMTLKDKNGVSVPFSLTRPKPAVLELQSDQIMHDQTYVLEVTAASDVLDGFGQPLLGTSLTLNMRDANTLFAFDPAAQFEADFKGDFEFVHRMQGAQIKQSNNNNRCVQNYQSISAINIEASSLAAAVEAVAFGIPMANPTTTVTLKDSTDGFAKVDVLPTDGLFGSSQSFMYHTSSWDFNCQTRLDAPKVVSRADLAISLIVGSPSVAVVTQLSDNSLVDGAKVTIYNRGSRHSNEKPSVLASGTTSKGVVELTIAANTRYYGAIATVEAPNGEVLLSTNVPIYRNNNQDLTSTRIVATTDRNLYKEQDVVSVKGYIRSFDSDAQIKPASKTTKLTATVVWNDADPKSRETYEAEVNEFGAFVFDMEVPDAISYSRRAVYLSAAGGSGYVSVNIADPRIPTGVLTLSSDDKVYKPSVAGKTSVGVKLDVTTKTYTGAPLPQSVVTIDWKVSAAPTYRSNVFYAGLRFFYDYFVPRFPTVEQAPPPSGSFEIKTNDDGELEDHTFVADLNGYELKDGASISLTARMIGPTREQLTSELQLPVQPSEWTLALKPSTPTPLPGLEFAVFVDLKDFAGTSLNGEKINVQLIEATAAEFARPAALIDATTNRLRRLANEANAAECSAQSDSGRGLQCSFTMNKATKYILKATTTDPSGSTVEAALVLGRTAEEWQRNPLNNFPSPELVPSKQQFADGDSVEFQFMNPFSSAHLVLYRGNALATEYEVVELKKQGRTTVKMSAPVGRECRGGCSLLASLIAGRDAQRSLAATVPTSILFDLKAPRALWINTNLAVDSDSLELGSVDISTDAEDDVTSPRSALEITVDVKDLSGKAVKDGEVHLFVVDQKVLDLAPHAVLRAQDGFKAPNLRANFGLFQSQRSLSQLSTHAQTLVQVQRRAERGPWTRPRWNSQADISDLDFYRTNQARITTFGNGACRSCDSAPVGNENAAPPPGDLGGGGDFNNAPQAAPGAGAPEADDAFDGGRQEKSAAAADGNSNSASASATAPPTREAPVYTPLSVTARIVDGQVKVVLEKMPDNLGTFRIAALATDGNAYLQAEHKIVSKLRYNVEPSMPRIARVDDRFVAGVTVSSDFPDSMYPIDLWMAVRVDCLYIGLLDKRMNKEVTLTKPGPVRVEWGFEAVGVTPDQDAEFLFTLMKPNSDKTNVAEELDSVRTTLSVLPQQPAVLAATSFAVEATPEGVAWPEGIVIPEHVANSASVSIEAGVGRLPSIKYYSEQLVAATEAKRPSGLDYAGGLHATALLDDFDVESELAKRVNGAFSAASSNLRRLTLGGDIGLVYYVPKYRRPSYADVRLNCYATWVYNQLAESDATPLASLAAQWRSAVNAGMNARAANARRYRTDGRFRDYGLLVQVFFTFGFDWKPSAQQYQAEMSVATLFANLDELSGRSRAMLAAAILQQADSLESDRSDTLKELLQELINKMRVQGRTAYVAATSGSPHADPAASYVGLLALAENTADKAARVADPDQLIEKLANYAAAPRAIENNRWYRVGTQQASMAAVALARYDQTRGNDMPDFTLRVVSGDKDILGQKGSSNGVVFNDPNQSPATTRINAYNLSPVDNLYEKDQLVVFAKGSAGEASVVAGIDFVPCERRKNAAGVTLPKCNVSKEPVYRGISVEKVVRAYNPSTGESDVTAIESAASGTQVEVTIQITTPDDLDNVRVTDWLSAGLEAFEFAQPAAQPYTPPFFGNDFGGGFGGFDGGEKVGGFNGGFASPVRQSYPSFYGWWTWESFPIKEVRSDRVEAFAHRLTAGTHSFSYKALVVTPGIFAMPPTKAYAVDQPELLGLSGGGVWGSADPAWEKIEFARTAKVCTFDAINLLGDEDSPTYVPDDTDPVPDRPRPTPVGPGRPDVTSAATVSLSLLAVVAMMLVALI